jgi:hypothetical protein
MDLLAKLIEVMKIPARYSFGVAVVLSIVLFAPPDLINEIGLLEYRESSRVYFGVSLLVCLAVVIANITKSTTNYILKKYRTRMFIGAGKKRLKTLTNEEKEILREYILRQTRTIHLDHRSGVVSGLVTSGIIYRSSNISSWEHGSFAFAHNIQPWAWNYLNKNHSYLS